MVHLAPAAATATHRFASLAAAIAWLCLLPGCDADVSAPTDATDPGALKADDHSTCLGPPPRCVGACLDRTRDTSATCVDATWHCPFGIREDFCCDPLTNPGSCPEWGSNCNDIVPCQTGYTCVASRYWPLPATTGTCRLGQWSIPETLTRCDDPTFIVAPGDLLSRPTSMVHVEGIVRAVMKCEDRRCTPDIPCCQQCTGSYQLELRPDDRLPFTVALRAETLACAGTNCGFSCAPLQVGRRYRLWGLWSPDAAPAKPGMIYLAGHCRD